MANLADRRRINGPAGGTSTPVFNSLPVPAAKRTRAPGQLRRIFLKTGITPSASGSAYLELEPSKPSIVTPRSVRPPVSGLKLCCSVHGPRPLPRSAPFTPQLLLSARVKYAPSANHLRRGYVPDATERDLAAHLETALRGILIGERWPKSGVDVIITILESEEGESVRVDNWENFSVLAGCITAASAAIADAGIDCLDLVTGGVAAMASGQVVLDPCLADHETVDAACVVGYLQSRDELTELWSQGSVITAGMAFEPLVDNAVEAAKAARMVLVEALNESTEQKPQQASFDST